ncbi:serine/threonine-protein kinase [Nocardia paucivorans]|uniref:serine/threonine-protein kinase n=1 Tax=Nocardia paucivorans TaxID=114259 RepID=UPI000312131A|nr:serine/threonine-protein kinase [Nocardia paucivorans]
MLERGDNFAGYVIRRRLGVGGMAMVFLARHPRLPRLVALKLLDPRLYTDNEIRRRFDREAELAARLEHPNIVTVYDRGDENQQLWISMQYVAGADAASIDVKVLDPNRAVQIIADTAEALDFAHANQVLHRDVKPANILLAKAPIGQPERVLLTDFGIAGRRDAETTLAAPGTITATLAYAAPEQLLGTTLDHRGDQYSLACTLFWLLTGRPPYPGRNPVEIINGHLRSPIPRPSRLRPGLPAALDDVLARALAKDREDRYSSCSEFAQAARHALRAHGPLGGYAPAHPYPPAGRARVAPHSPPPRPYPPPRATASTPTAIDLPGFRRAPGGAQPEYRARPPDGPRPP